MNWGGGHSPLLYWVRGRGYTRGRKKGVGGVQIGGGIGVSLTPPGTGWI